MRKLLALTGALALVAGSASAQLTVVFQDDFESYASNAELTTAAGDNQWSENTLGIGLHDGAFTRDDQSVGQAAGDGNTDRLLLEGAMDLDPRDAPIRASYWFYDPTGEDPGHAGMAIGRSLWGHMFVGLGSSMVSGDDKDDFYHARLMDGGPGWVVTTAPRSVGWQKLEIVLDDGTVEVFHNDGDTPVADGTFTSPAAWNYANWVRFAPPIETAGDDFYYDDFVVATGTPEDPDPTPTPTPEPTPTPTPTPTPPPPTEFPFTDDFEAGAPQPNWEWDSDSNAAWDEAGTWEAVEAEDDWRGTLIEPPDGDYMGKLSIVPPGAQTLRRIVGTYDAVDYVVEADIFVPTVDADSPPDNFFYQQLQFAVRPGSDYTQFFFQNNEDRADGGRMVVRTRYGSFSVVYEEPTEDALGYKDEGWYNVRIYVNNSDMTMNIVVDGIALNDGDPITVTQGGYADGGKTGVATYINGAATEERAVYYDNFSVEFQEVGVDDWMYLRH